MADRKFTLTDILDGDLPARWKGEKDRLSQFLKGVGVTGDEHSQSLYIFPQPTRDPIQYLNTLRAQVDDREHWALITGRRGAHEVPTVIAFPVSKNLRIEGLRIAQAALFIEVHSRLVS